VFEALAQEVLPALFEARASSRQLRIWSAGCSTGQEPYSVAMTVRESLPRGTSWDISILATDLSEQVVERVRAGSYRSAELDRGMPDAYRDKYMQQEGDGWVVAKELQSMVTPRPMNLAAMWPPLPTMDIVLLRNVLMYLSTETRRSILRKLCSMVAPDGYLFLGSSESSGQLDARWEPTRKGRVVYYRPCSKELSK
jgi:chemotaxis protein methyltransferase CheR